MTNEDDYELLRRWIAGDNRAGNRLLTRHYRRISSHFACSVGESERRDLTQETFARLVKAKDGFEGRSSFLSFLFGIARNVLNEHLRARYSAKGHFDPLTHSVEDVGGVSPSQMISTIARHQALLDAMRALPADTKQLLELYHWQGLTAGALAEMYGIPEPTIRGRIHAAKQKVITLLARDGHAWSVDDLDACVREIAIFYDQGPNAGVQEQP